jgi:hypothetical protein
MSSIGGISVIGMNGHESLLMVPEVADITRENVDGVAFKAVGKKSNRIQVGTTMNSADAAASIVAYRAKEKTFVTVVTPDGLTITNVFVHRVSVRGQKVATAVGGVGTPGGAWLVTAVWVLQVTNV